MMRLTFILLVPLLCLSPLSAVAQDLGQMLLSAQANGSISTKAKFRIRLEDDSDLNLRLRDVLSARLKNAGYTIDSNTPSFVIWLKSDRITWSDDRNKTIGSLRVGSTIGDPTGSLNNPRGSEVDFNVKLWSSTQNSLLGRNNHKRAPRQGFQLVLDVFDIAKDAYVWQGSARAAGLDSDSFRAGQAMTASLVEVLGETIEPTIMELF